MFWVDETAKKIKERKLKLEWVDDMKTPSGKIHIGSLRGVVIHDLVYKSLKDLGVNTKLTYVFDNHDPMDALPVYLDKEKYKKYLGVPLYKVPSPVTGYDNYADYYAKDFASVFTKIGCNPEILWASKIYMSGQMNKVIKEVLDKADLVRNVYEELYKKEMPKDWYPFQPFCSSCGKVSTTKAIDWDGETIKFICKVDHVKWTNGCGFEGRIPPFSSNAGMTGKLPWKIEWPAKWKALGITVEGAGKDHMSAGGSHDFAKHICDKVINYPVPYPLSYEFFLIGGKKMSSSKGIGLSASEMLEILPAEILRFLMVKTKMNQAINFDPEGETIPVLFDEYQKCANAYFGENKDEMARIFELSQVADVKKPPTVRFSTLVQWVQMPNMEEEIKKEGLSEWAKYARVWLERYAPEKDKFMVRKELPKEVESLNNKQKEYLSVLISEDLDFEDAEKLQIQLYNLAKEHEVGSKDAFTAIYITLIGKTSGPKAAWFIQSLGKDFIQKRFTEASR